jgi:hypothetical protein
MDDAHIKEAQNVHSQCHRMSSHKQCMFHWIFDLLDCTTLIPIHELLNSHYSDNEQSHLLRCDTKYCGRNLLMFGATCIFRLKQYSQMQTQSISHPNKNVGIERQSSLGKNQAFLLEYKTPEKKCNHRRLQS